ncbi:hypothetical protein [Kitasatospora sp. NPDC056181]|uniref:hypothetical protein n=1 Tax=Kitasatospora sp. NPDC056181 TaxID=3345737 RepID=UPI0035D82F37
MTAHDAEIRVDHSQYWIGTAGSELDPGMYEGFNGVVSTRGDSFAIIMTGTEFGPVQLRYEPHGQAPPLTLDEWDDVVEVSMRLDTDTRIHGPIPDDRVAGLPPVSHQGPGPYRIRVHTRGRDAARALGDIFGPPAEHHLIQTWPAPQAPETCHKLTDQYGRCYRNNI